MRGRVGRSQEAQPHACCALSSAGATLKPGAGPHQQCEEGHQVDSSGPFLL